MIDNQLSQKAKMYLLNLELNVIFKVSNVEKFSLNN